MTQYSVFVTHGSKPIARVVGINATDRKSAISKGIGKVRVHFRFGKGITLFGEAREAQPGDKFEPIARVIEMGGGNA